MRGQPTQAAFLSFLRNIGIKPAYLPDDAPVITWAYDFALNVVNTALACVPSQPTSWSIYERAVYNLGADTVFNWADDQDGQCYFTEKRKAFGINEFVAGVVEASSDQGTSQTLAVPDALKELTLGQLQNLKTPYGRQYLALAQSYGTIWGLN